MVSLIYISIKSLMHPRCLMLALLFDAHLEYFFSVAFDFLRASIVGFVTFFPFFSEFAFHICLNCLASIIY